MVRSSIQRPLRDGDVDDVGADRCQWETRVWSHRQKENRMIEATCKRIRWLMVRLAEEEEDNEDRGDGSNDDSAQTPPTKSFFHDDTTWKYASCTMFDLPQILPKPKDPEDPSGKVTPYSFLSSLEHQSDSYGESDKQMHNFWNAMLEEPPAGFSLGSSSSWEDVLLVPLRSAASGIIESIDHKSIHKYLCVHTTRTLEHL